MTDNPLKPSIALLAKLGSIVVHAQEMLSPKGHYFDRTVMEALLRDEEVKSRIKEMSVYVPIQR